MNYIYFYYNLPITKRQFLAHVPLEWEANVINGEYSQGEFKAVKMDNND